jgi:ABC-type Fe3+-hydroxamate transport system substrate-binding protein
LTTCRAVFVTMPRLLSDIVWDFASRELDLTLIGHICTRDALNERVIALNPDLILLGLYAGETYEIAQRMTDLAPTAKVIAISNDCRIAHLYETRGIQKALLDFSLQDLLSSIRDITLTTHR